MALAVCAVFGALLIGGGVILLLAHNWEFLSRGARATIAIAPLVVTQFLAGWVLLRREASTAWREGSAILLALMAATAIALVDQTYHTGGDLESFLWRWALLLAPLPWLLNSTGAAILFLGALTWWAGAAMVGGEQVLLLWPLAAAEWSHTRSRCFAAAAGGSVQPTSPGPSRSFCVWLQPSAWSAAYRGCGS